MLSIVFRAIFKSLPLTLLREVPIWAQAIFVLLFIGYYATWTFVGVDKYKSDIHKRDDEIRYYGTITGKHREREYFLDYSYIPPGTVSAINSEHHEVSSDNYEKYQVGDRVPIKYDPHNFKDTHLDVQGYWSNARLAISAILLCALESMPLALILYLTWAGLGYAVKKNRANTAAPSPA